MSSDLEGGDLCYKAGREIDLIFLVFHFLMKNLNLLYFNQQFKKILHSFSERAMLHNYIIASSTNKSLLPAMKPQIC